MSLLFQATCGFPKPYTTFLSPVEGTQPYILSTDLTMQLDNENPTSFVVVSANGLRSAFIGSSAGNLFKVVIFSILLIFRNKRIYDITLWPYLVYREFRRLD